MNRSKRTQLIDKSINFNKLSESYFYELISTVFILKEFVKPNATKSYSICYSMIFKGKKNPTDFKKPMIHQGTSVEIFFIYNIFRCY